MFGMNDYNDDNMFGFVSPEAMEAFSKNGYRNPAMALGELVDNSIEAESTMVSIVLTIHKTGVVRRTETIDNVAIIDNGCGMNSLELRHNLRLGKGTHRNTGSGKKTMGKFGVGLPQASIAMAKRIDVWSWQDGYKTAKHAYIDLRDPSWINTFEIQEPDDKPISERYIQFIGNNKSGTIVEWSDLTEGFSWRKPSTVFKHAQKKIGRMHRHFLNDGNVTINMFSIDVDGKIDHEEKFKPIDPLFLMEHAYYPDSPRVPPFVQYGSDHVEEFEIDTPEGKKKACVTLRFSIASKEVWPGDMDIVPGNTPIGKLAKENMGVSIVRENRELELIENWWKTYDKDSRQRWWGAEIMFNRDMDDIFVVTSNKQSATKLFDMAVRSMDDIFDEYDIDKERGSYDLSKIKESDPNLYPIVRIVTLVNNKIQSMYNQINTERTSQSQSKNRHNHPSENQNKYDVAVKERMQNDETCSETDKIVLSGSNRISDVSKDLENDSSYSDDAKSSIIEDVMHGHRCSIVCINLDTSAFFSIERKSSQMILKLNTEHPLYSDLFGVYDDILSDGVDLSESKVLSITAFESLKLILQAWARMEDEALSATERSNYRKVRENWGRMLDDFAKSNEDN